MRRIEGTHLVIDGYVTDVEVLEPTSIFHLFDSLVNALGMQYLTEPSASVVPQDPELIDSDEDEGGVSYWAQITTSHLALHAWPLRKAFMMDIFSCRPFDVSKAIIIVLEALEVESHVSKTIAREDPHLIQGARGI